MNEHELQPMDSKKDLAHKVLDRIEEERVVPLPKWQFTIKDRLFWVFWILSLVLGALVAGALFFAFINAGWEYRVVTHQNFFGFVMQVLPTIWIVAVLGAMLIAYENFRHTSRGYRVPLLAVIGLSLLGITLGGLFFYVSGAGKLIEEEIGGRIPLYRPVMLRQKQIWSRPEQGLLAGEVIQYDAGQSTFRLRGFNGDVFFMSTQDLTSDSKDLLVEREPVRVVGVFAKPTDGPDKPFFRPCYVFPWEPRNPGLFHVTCDPERTFEESRNTECKGLIPYDILKTLRRGACR